MRRLAALDGLFLVLLLGWNDEATFARGEMDAVTVVSLENEKVKGTVEVGRLFETKVGVEIEFADGGAGTGRLGNCRTIVFDKALSFAFPSCF